MRKERCRSLWDRVQWMNGMLGQEKPANPTGIPFEIHKVQPLSEDTGVSIHIKPDGRKAIVFWYFTNVRPDGRWDYIIPTDNHMAGMAKLAQIKQDVEDENFRIAIEEGQIP